MICKGLRDPNPLSRYNLLKVLFVIIDKFNPDVLFLYNSYYVQLLSLIYLNHY